ncbi:cyclic nucleotide-binding protein [Legionella steelei]|uniref:Cyclic nucleotide-binding protein n=1 Tax=Legionella steelei TaxID=947033 RepID=A0A0W0ZG55_9GAMM|nr:cyclic nucleotide-binding domain-containing protein [Legionella steelei]KTD67846.1 cyclic nucleotide-binding protein [Legionella steelei]
MDTLEILKSSELFSNLSDTQLVQLVSLCHQEHFENGDFLINEGDCPGPCFLIVSGRVQVYRERGYDRKWQLAELGPGAILGELAIIDGLPRSASIVALEDTEALAIDEEDFKKMMENNPLIALNLLPHIAKILRRTQDELYLTTFVLK